MQIPLGRYSREGRAAELARYLPDRRRQRRSRFARRPKGLVFPPERAIQNRPDWVMERTVFGSTSSGLFAIFTSLEAIPQVDWHFLRQSRLVY